MTQHDDPLREYLLAFGKTLNIARLEQHLGIGTRLVRHWLAGTRGMTLLNYDKVHRWARERGYRPPGCDDLGQDVCNAFGSPHFNAEAIMKALEQHRSDSSVATLMNVLPGLAEISKRYY